MTDSRVTNDAMNMLVMALKKEENAYNFYNRAMNMVILSNVRDLFQELAGEELRHKEIILEYIDRFKKEGPDWQPPEDINNEEDIGFSKYLVSTKLTEETTYQNALIIAMKREELAYVMLNNFYKIVKDEVLKDLFKQLMKDELEHLKKIEAKYDEDIMSDN